MMSTENFKGKVADMKYKTSLSVLGAFIAGLLISPQMHRLIPVAHAEQASLTPFMLDLLNMKREDMTITPYPDFRSRALVVTSSGTVGVQSGNVPKHMHMATDEVQYIIEGSGTMWLGDQRQEFKPGTLIVIPKGTAHAGSIVSSGPVKALVIKMPPQGKDDTVLLN